VHAGGEAGYVEGGGCCGVDGEDGGLCNRVGEEGWNHGRG